MGNMVLDVQYRLRQEDCDPRIRFQEGHGRHARDAGDRRVQSPDGGARQPGKESMEKIQIEDDAYLACSGAHAVAILTEWDAFKSLDYQRLYDSMQKPAFVFDGRNVAPLEELKRIGFQVYGIGQSLGSSPA